MMDDEVILVETVSHKETMFTDRQRKNAALERQAQMRMGYPSVRDIVNRGRVLNLPVTKNNLDNAERIWGKDMGSRASSGKPLAKDHPQWSSNLHT